jgi:hypothetical protein
MTKKLSKLHEQLRNTEQGVERKEILRNIKLVRKTRNTFPSRIRTGVRIYYVRYADDWVVGLVGTKADASRLRDELGKFLRDELRLELSLEKTRITNITSSQVKFLGVKFWIPRAVQAKIVQKFNPKAGRIIKSRINQTRIYFAAPIAEILTKLEDKGFIKRYSQDQNRLVPNAITKWIFLDHKAIIQRYNHIIRGLLNYYSFVDNLAKFHQICDFLLRHSCAKTLARKMKPKTRSGAFKKFGKKLGVTMKTPKGERTYALDIPETFKKTRKFQIGKYDYKDPFGVLEYRLESQSNLDEICAVCGSEDRVEMHHVRHLRKGGVTETGFTTLMSKLNRKQIPVCKPCHLKIHKGLYNGLSLSELWIRAAGVNADDS